MNEFQVTFLDRPLVGVTARIIYNGKAGQTDQIVSVWQNPTQQNYFRVITMMNVVCSGVFNPSAALVPGQPQFTIQSAVTANHFPARKARSLWPWILGMSLFFIAWIWCLVLISIAKNSHVSSTPNYSGLSLQSGWAFDEERCIAGNVINNSDNTYSYAEIEFNVYDDNNNRVGTAMDNINNLGPHETWKFRAPVLEESGHSVKFEDLTGY
ncbi:MAG: FxLYD domain-containing protein [Armatimonadota bacterium]|nr:FxLYD domain-containing protein [bacterium]